jgi:Family of unknown function (DUF6167)
MMIGRIFWFLLGIGVAVFVLTKVRAALKQASPDAIGHRVAESAGNLGERAQDFAARVRAGMAERETEIRESFGMTE